MTNEFEYKGKKYVRIDFKNQYTFEQADLFEPIGNRVTDVALYLSKEARNIPTLTKEQEKDPVLVQKKQQAELQLAIKLKEMYNASNVLPELLAHVWYNKEDEEFNPDTYNERVKMFKKMPIGKREELELEEAINDFLSVAMKSSTGGIQSLFPKVKK